MSGATQDQLDELKVALTSYNSAAKELAEKKPIIDKLGVEQAMQSVGGVVDGAGHTHTVLGSYSNQIGSGSSVINTDNPAVTKADYDQFVNDFFSGDPNVLPSDPANALAATGSTVATDFTNTFMAGLKSKFPKSTTDTSNLNSSLSSRITDANVQNAINKDTKDAAISALKDLFPSTLGGKKRTRKAKKAK